MRFDDYKKNIVYNQCLNDKHIFDANHKCVKCGLSVDGPDSLLHEEYFGSYINGISHKWDSSDMQAKDIVNIKISFGNLPIVNVTYDGFLMKVKNKINGSRDGGRPFPDGFFDEKLIKLSEQDINELNECLLSDTQEITLFLSLKNDISLCPCR